MSFFEGDPRVFDRDLFQRLTSLERWAAVKTYEQQGWRRRRDQEQSAFDRFEPPPVSIARNAIVQGLFSLVIFLVSPVLILSGVLVLAELATGMEWVGGLGVGLGYGGVAFGILAAVTAVIRRWQVDRILSDRYGEDFPRAL